MSGQKTDDCIHLTNWYATFCYLAGVDPTDEEAAKAKLLPIDSMNMWPQALISGQNSTSLRTDIPASNFTLISGDYKIITGSLNFSVWTSPQSPNTTTGQLHVIENCGDGCLFNIKTDPTEHVNLATKMPDVLKEMQNKLKKYQETCFNPDRVPEACDTAI